MGTGRRGFKEHRPELGELAAVWRGQREACNSAEAGAADFSSADPSLDGVSCHRLSEYRVSLDSFDGPLDLLLYLVKHDEVDIYDIPLERLTRPYLEYLDQARELDVPLAGEFIVMAANLLYLKSRALLPKEVQPPGEDTEEDDPRGDLIRQLIEYKKFKDAAAHLSESEASRSLRFSPRPGCPRGAGGELPLELKTADLVAAFERVLARATPGRIMDDRWTVSEKIADLRGVIQPGNVLRFSELFRQGASREELIATFLAILELMKTREFRASQNGFLGDIELQRQ